MKIKKFNEMGSINEETSVYDWCDDIKDDYYLMLIKNDDFDDNKVIDILEEIGVSPDIFRNSVPFVYYFSKDWFGQENNLSNLNKFVSKIKPEMDKLGLETDFFEHGVSECDFETENDVPPKVYISLKK